MARLSWFALLGLLGNPLTGCGPDAKPEPPCDGPTFNLAVTVDEGALPPDTHINVRYGGNQEGEPYNLGEASTPQAVFCSEEASAGGASSSLQDLPSGTGGAAAGPLEGEPIGVLRCRLYTQGPARLDVSATGYLPIDDRALSLDHKKRCEVEVNVTLTPKPPSHTN